MKKILSMILCLAMIFMLNVNVFAAEGATLEGDCVVAAGNTIELIVNVTGCSAATSVAVDVSFSDSLELVSGTWLKSGMINAFFTNTNKGALGGLSSSDINGDLFKLVLKANTISQDPQTVSINVIAKNGATQIMNVTVTKQITIGCANHTYEGNHICTVCGQLEEGVIADVAGYTISLGGNIAVNYFMKLSDEVLADVDAKVVFTVPDTGSTYTLEVPVSEAVISGAYYVFTCEVAAKEMTSQILAQVVTSDSNSETFPYTVQQYAEAIIANPDLYGEEAADLVKAMLNYGASAQVYFNYNTDNLANDTESMTEGEKTLQDIDLSDFAYELEGEQSGVTYYGSTLSLKSETAIKHFFRFENEEDVQNLEITVNGNAVTPVKNGSYYEIKISDIPAHHLGDGVNQNYEVKIGDLTLRYVPFSYGNSAMATDKEILKNVIRAMYAYYQDAVDYQAYLSSN